MKRSTLVSFFIFFFQISFGQTGTIEGEIHDNRQNSGLAFASVWLEDTEIGSVTDLDGQFRIDSIPFGTYNLIASYVAYGDTIIQGLVVSDKETLEVNLSLPPYCIYDAQGTSNVCPICKKSDKVIPIIYGLPVGKMSKEKYLYSGCNMTYCDPDWYCKRDKNKFGRRKKK